MFTFAALYFVTTLVLSVIGRPIDQSSTFIGRASDKSSTSSSDNIFSFDNNGHATREISDGKYKGRSYLVHTPANYDNSKKHPLVLSFHGNGGTSSKQQTITQLSDSGLLINKLGIIAVYPQASLGKGKNGGEKKKSWQGAPYAADGVDDIGFTNQIIDEVTKHLAVDTSRIYATGKSNGGGFTNLLACTPSINTRIAAFATVSAALYPGTHPGAYSNDTEAACDPKKEIPILISHGYKDTTIPYYGQTARSGSTDYRTPNIDTFAQSWAARNAQYASGSGGGKNNAKVQTEQKFTTSTPHPNAQQKLFTSSNVLQISVQDLAHCWPSKDGLDCGKASFDLTPANLVAFLEKYTTSGQ